MPLLTLGERPIQSDQSASSTLPGYPQLAFNPRVKLEGQAVFSHDQAWRNTTPTSPMTDTVPLPGAAFAQLTHLGKVSDDGSLRKTGP